MKRRGLRLALAVLCALAAVRATADTTAVRASIEPSLIGLGETATFTIEVRGTGLASQHFRPDFAAGNPDHLAGIDPVRILDDVGVPLEHLGPSKWILEVVLGDVPESVAFLHNVRDLALDGSRGWCHSRLRLFWRRSGWCRGLRGQPSGCTECQPGDEEREKARREPLTSDLDRTAGDQLHEFSPQRARVPISRLSGSALRHLLDLH